MQAMGAHITAEYIQEQKKYLDEVSARIEMIKKVRPNDPNNDVFAE